MAGGREILQYTVGIVQARNDKVLDSSMAEEMEIDIFGRTLTRTNLVVKEGRKFLDWASG